MWVGLFVAKNVPSVRPHNAIRGELIAKLYIFDTTTCYAAASLRAKLAVDANRETSRRVIVDHGLNIVHARSR